MKKGTVRWLKIAAGVVFTALALWLSFRKVDWISLQKAFVQVNLVWVGAALISSLLTLFLLGWRWQILLKPKHTFSLGTLFRLNVISQYTNIIMPARLGEVARAYLASREKRISGGFVMGTVVIEKILSFLVFLVLWILIPTFFSFQNAVQGYGAALGLAIAFSIILILFIWRPRIILKGTSALSKILPQKLRTRIQNFAENSVEAFGILKNGKILSGVLFLTLVLLGGQVLTNFILFQAFHMELSLWAGLVVLLALKVGHIPPSLPGKLGVFEYATILALGLFGVTKGVALSYALVLHVLAYLPKILLGMVFIQGVEIKRNKS